MLFSEDNHNIQDGEEYFLDDLDQDYTGRDWSAPKIVLP